MTSSSVLTAWQKFKGSHTYWSQRLRLISRSKITAERAAEIIFQTGYVMGKEEVGCDHLMEDVAGTSHRSCKKCTYFESVLKP